MIVNPQEKCVLLSILMIYHGTLCEEICKSDRPQQVIFTQRVQDYILSGPIVKTELVASDQECQMQCILSFKCDVFDLGPLDESFRRSCKILRYEIKNYTLQRQKGWSFRARKCAYSPCLNGGTCFSIDQANAPRCACIGNWTSPTCSDAVGCKDDWIRNDIFCYKMFKTEVTFFEANSSCLNGGAELVSIEESQELSFLDELLIKEHVDKIYVGMTDIAEEDRWVWMDGSPVTFDPLWHGNHPNGGTNENCGEYVKQHGFHDKNCETDKRPFVCKYSLYNL
ncbi:aggrecan core protein-like [Stylophora pistillata]|uniref:aggrecan core protein-like n=1 Tax=Stylophora pistillata TaxID=50429 RepID=UPI000C04103E|nr:aggrecan core protein-like [Stylophora pistillata]